MDFSYLDGVPLVTDVVTAADGYPALVVRDRDESLKRMAAEIARLEELLEDGTVEACDYGFKRGWHCTRGRGHGGPCALWPSRWQRIKHWLSYGGRLPR